MPKVLKRASSVTADGAPNLTKAAAGSRPGYGVSGTIPMGSGAATPRGRSRPGRLRARLCRLLPALAALAGALGLLAAGPAQAQNTLRALTVEVSTDGVNFSRVDFHPEFRAGQESFKTVVSASHTHVRVTPVANLAGATMKVGKQGTTLSPVTSGSPSGAIALTTGSNQIQIDITAPGHNSNDYYVTVIRGGREKPSPPRYVKATASAAKLTLTWTAPAHWGSFPAGGYEMRWYAGASPPTDDSDWNWVARSRQPGATATSYEFTGTYGTHTVADGTAYQLQIRAFGTNPDDAGDYLPSFWVTVAGTPPSGSSQSSDARLSALTAGSATSSTGPYGTLGLTPSAFSAATTEYAASVANARTHVKLTPTVNETSATVKVGKQGTTLSSVTSGQASGAIALDVGANTITVQVTAHDGSAMKDYTVTVTRAAAQQTRSTNANLSALTAGSSTSSTGTFTDFGIGTFAATDTSYMATVANDQTHVKVTPTVADTGKATVGVRKGTSGNFSPVTSGSPSSAIALDLGANEITVRVTAEDGTTMKDYTVTVTRPAAAPTGLTVTPGDAELRVSWTASSNADDITGHDLHFTSAAPADVANDAALFGTNPTVAWVAVASSLDNLATSHTIDSDDATLTNGVTYRVRLRAVQPDSVWVFGSGTPQAAQPPGGVTLSADNATPVEGGSVTVTATLDTAAPTSGVTLTLEVLAKVSGTIYSSATATDDYTLSPATISIASGQTTGTATLATVDDSAVEDIHYTIAGETVVLKASSTTPALSSQPLVVTILDDDGPFANRRAGAPTLAAITSGNDTPTATTLAFTVGCVSGGESPITDYVLWAENVADASDWHTQRFAPSGPSGCATFGPVTMTGLPERTSATTYRVRAYARSITGFRTPWSQPVEVATLAAANQVLGNSGDEEEDLEPPAALTASFEGAPAEHDGRAFTFDVRFSEALGAGGKAPGRASFRAVQGRVESVARVEAGLWRVRVKPVSWRDVTVTLRGGRDCAALYAVCTADGRALENSPDARVGGSARIETRRSLAREGRDASMRFWVKLSRAASHAVTVDWTTADGRGTWARIPPATAGADYTATSGRLTFAPGETRKTVSVAILDDAVDEGTEYFLLRFSNPQGGYLEARHRERQGLIRNDDPLQRMWLSRFGRTAGSQVADAVSERLAGGLAPGAHMTLAGQPLDLGKAGDGMALADAMTGLAQRFGAPGAPANPGYPERVRARSGAGSAAASAPARSMTGQELLLGSSFHVAGGGEGSGPVLAAWGRVAQAGFDGEEASDGGRTSIDGEVVTGTLGADADWGRMLAGVAVSLSEGEGGFDQPGVDKGSIESALTTVSPYARVKVTERVSAWSLLGWGTGDMTITQDAREATGSRPARAGAVTKTDISMQMGAIGARGALMEQDDAGGMDLVLKTDAFFVRMESEKAAGSAATVADASRLRLVLEGGRAFTVGADAIFRPSLELGVRHDGGDAETGTGLEIGGGVAYADAASGLSLEAKARTLAAHADSGYREWGASATARLDPGERGRGLSFSLSPTIGSAGSATDRLWEAHDARGLAPGPGSGSGAGSGFEASRGLTAEAGYGLALFGDRFTGTPNVGLRMSDGGARNWRIGWRLAPAMRGHPGFEVSLDATRREAGNDNGPVDHGVILNGALRW